MENVMTNGFAELSVNEMEAIDGGIVLFTIAIGTAKIAVTLGMCVKAGATIGLGSAAIIAISNN